jgi:hypothetical protein
MGRQAPPDDAKTAARRRRRAADTGRWLRPALPEKHYGPRRASRAALGGQRLIQQLSYLDKMPCFIDIVCTQVA